MNKISIHIKGICTLSPKSNELTKKASFQSFESNRSPNFLSITIYCETAAAFFFFPFIILICSPFFRNSSPLSNCFWNKLRSGWTI